MASAIRPVTRPSGADVFVEQELAVWSQDPGGLA
jgi:hypothetical protein